MCGRFALFTPPARLARFFAATLADDVDPDASPSWNVAPTDTVYGFRSAGASAGEAPPAGTGGDAGAAGGRILEAYRWGLIPPQSKDSASASRLCNARAETVGTRTSFRSAYGSHRLVVPADGFYEWRKGPGKAKQPHYFHRVDDEPIAFAGLWELWRPPPGRQPGGEVRSCTIITTRAGQDMDGIHDRMPVVLNADTLDAWLDPCSGRPELDALLRPAPAGTLVHHAVDRRVGNVRVNGPELVVPVPAAHQPSLLEAPPPVRR